MIASIVTATPHPDGSDGVSTENLQAFKESLKLDAECAAAISKSLETTAAEKFANILGKCTGRVLVSGIGKCPYSSLSLSSEGASKDISY